MYDSTNDTLKHIHRVQELLDEHIAELAQRAAVHDESKFHPPEKEAFDRETPLLERLEYDSPEYKESLDRLGEGLKHHYSVNRHHPEFHPNGVNDMTLGDIDEMFHDWKAGSERHKTGDIRVSIGKNAERFGLSPQLVQIFLNTAAARGW